jgi:hypothetical protein
MSSDAGAGGSAQTPATALCQRALAGDDSAAVEVLSRLAAGDGPLMRYVSQPQDEAAGRVREAVVGYLARGRWQGRTLGLPGGSHAGKTGRRLRDLIAQACQTGSASCWEQSLLTLTRDLDPLVREIAIHLLECSRAPEVITALLAALNDRDERVRWAAAFELARSGPLGAEAVLRQIVTHEITPESRHVMAYVLRRTGDESLRQQSATVVEALDAADYRVAAPLAANQVLARMGGAGAHP